MRAGVSSEQVALRHPVMPIANGLGIPAWSGSASAASADRWSKRGRTGQRETFSAAYVAGQKPYPILHLRKPVWRPFRNVT
jgi:hypothetical protein